MTKSHLLGFCLLAFSTASIADMSKFSTGPVFENYGKNADIPNGISNPKIQKFKVLFDVSDTSAVGNVNRSFDTVARFINMHVRAGVPMDNIDVAIVVHGKASNDLLKNKAYNTKLENDNHSAELVELLMQNSVRVFICGQSATVMDISADDLISGVSMSLSAMTANALLQQEGYTLNPF